MQKEGKIVSDGRHMKIRKENVDKLFGKEKTGHGFENGEIGYTFFSII